MKRATILVDAPFMEWGLDVIGSINPKSSQGHSYILTTTYDTEGLISFFEENIVSVWCSREVYN
jgi:hypothetical protein